MASLRCGVLGALVMVACSSSSGGPLRSPSLDYAPPAPSTADGDTVGADRRGPGDKVHEGVTTDGPAPGWHAQSSGVSYDPKQRVGGAVDPPPANGSSSSK